MRIFDILYEADDLLGSAPDDFERAFVKRSARDDPEKVLKDCARMYHVLQLESHRASAMFLKAIHKSTSPEVELTYELFMKNEKTHGVEFYPPIYDCNVSPAVQRNRIESGQNPGYVYLRNTGTNLSVYKRYKRAAMWRRLADKQLDTLKARIRRIEDKIAKDKGKELPWLSATGDYIKRKKWREYK